MQLFGGKQIEDIKESHLLVLIDNKVSEKKTVEYKRKLPGGTDKEKREFLADVSSFANAAGGEIIYGMTERGGIPQELIGLGQIDYDQEILRLENMCRDGISPRIPGLGMCAPPLKERGSALIIHIPRSYVSPHIVTFSGSSRFYSRNSRGKYQLDVFEIRAAFAATESLGEKIRAFRADRLAKIVADQTPVRLASGARCILHVVPFSAFDVRNIYDLKGLQIQTEDLAPIFADYGSNFRFNFDGVITSFRQDPESPAMSSYLQVFRNGILESVDTELLYSPGIRGLLFENELIKALSRYLELLETRIGVEPPVLVMLTLLGVRGYRMGVDATRYLREERTIDRDELIIPEVLVEDFSQSAAEILYPIFNAVWNAAGEPQSLYYDKNGTRKPS